MEKVEKLRKIALRYYSRKDIQAALLAQAKTPEGAHEVVPRYYENFGKRPDMLEYEQDIMNLALKGATSFHVSEEIWKNPLELSTTLKEEELNKLRVGWNLLLDVDCRFLEYSKIAAWLLCQALYFHGIRNIGLKYSGGSGFHIALSYKAFPEIVQGIKIKDFFPQGPRLIASYLKSMIAEELKKRIAEISSIKEIARAINKQPEYLLKKKCKRCNEEPIKKRILEYVGKEVKEREDLVCPKCNAGYSTNKDNFVIYEEFDPFSIVEIDTILISSRHLYRMAYSLHEKTGLASIVVKPESLKAFHPSWAKPSNVIPKPFIPEPERYEAKELFIQALDWGAKEKAKEKKVERVTEKFDKIKISVNEQLYPPCIKNILAGMKHDGRKRALFILINFLRSIGLDWESIENKIKEWNPLNYKPLKENYIATQLNWAKRQPVRLPPNCNLDKPAGWYKDIAVCMPDFLCEKIKNPVNYVVRKAKESKQKSKRKTKVF